MYSPISSWGLPQVYLPPAPPFLGWGPMTEPGDWGGGGREEGGERKRESESEKKKSRACPAGHHQKHNNAPLLRSLRSAPVLMARDMSREMSRE